VPEHPTAALIPRNGHASVVAAPAPVPDGGLDWRRYLTAVLRYRWWILAATALGVLGGIGASKYLPPRYLVQATIWIQSSDSRGPDRGQPIGANQLLAATAWTDLLRSYVVLDAVVREQRLYLRTRTRDRAAFAAFAVGEQFQPGRYRLRVDKAGAHYTLENADGAVVEQGNVGAPVGRTLGFVWTPAPSDLLPGSDIPFGVAPLRDAAKNLSDQLRVAPDPSGNFLRIALTGPDAAGAANIVNAIADRYVAVATELKRAKLTELARLLGEQLQAAEANLHRAERALEDFRVRTITLPSDLAGPAGAAVAPRASPVSGFFELRIEQDQLARDQQALAEALAQMRDSTALVEGLATIGAVQRAPDLAQALRELTAKRAEQRALAYRYTGEHPTLRRVSGEIEQLERRTIPDLTRTLAAELAARQRVLGQQVASGGRELREIPQRAIEEARLRRDVSIAENLFSAVQQRHSEARLAEASSIADVRLLDAAVAPQTPVRDTGARLLALGLLAGLGFGVLGAVLIDRFDPRVRYPDQVTAGMGLRILGALPHVKHRDAGAADEQVLQVIETMRSLRLSLHHVYGSAGPLVLTVSSPAVGDGKSFVSTNLALACAQAGQRTLLLDGDTRRGALHRVLQAQRKPGLTDYLAGNASLETVTQAVRFPSLQFIGAGSRLRESPELLGSPQMIDLLVRLRQQYQVIIVDSPPLGSGVDPYTLGTLTGAMILVLRTGATNLALTRTRLGMLEQLPIRLLGVLLNDVQRGELYGYYNYNYFPGYGAVDEDQGVQLTQQRMRGTREPRGHRPGAREWSTR
jgi:capsular exopolysaccharide synthesis family protein